MSDRTSSVAARLIEAVVDALDVPVSLYELAVGRYQSLADWLHRPESSVRIYDPHVYVQGSFRFGTVIRPWHGTEEYDLDIVIVLNILKLRMSQAELKRLVGEEIKAYARAHGMQAVKERNRCWRLDYRDEVKFHIDILPSVPEDAAFIQKLVQLGVRSDWAKHAIAITDQKHREFASGNSNWPMSNPLGFAHYFEERMASVARQQREVLVANRRYASIDDVPAFELKTTLQRSIQVLKRHRDVMFADEPELRPISAIITRCSAMAYEGQTNIYDALIRILERMPAQVQSHEPRVPNPTNPYEDYADKWKRDPRLEGNFWAWRDQALADIERFASPLSASRISEHIGARFSVRDASIRSAAERLAPAVPAVAISPPAIIRSPQRPWGYRA